MEENLRESNDLFAGRARGCRPPDRLLCHWWAIIDQEPGTPGRAQGLAARGGLAEGRRARGLPDITAMIDDTRRGTADGDMTKPRRHSRSTTCAARRNEPEVTHVDWDLDGPRRALPRTT